MNMVNELLLVLGHPEKIVFFRNLLGWLLMIRTVAIHQLFFCQETFAAPAVEASIFIKIDIAPVVDILQNFLHRSDMVAVSCPNKVIRLAVQKRPGAAKQVTDFIGILTWLNILFTRCFSDLVAMFIPPSGISIAQDSSGTKAN